MRVADHDRGFTGSIPQLYEQYLVPLIFEPYAQDLAKRVAERSPSRLLETAAGTGVVTRALAAILPEASSIVATDLNQSMLDEAARIGAPSRVRWRQADAMHLPFPDDSFDMIACQFGTMFFPDKPKAFAEARRVLRSRGRLLFSVWDRIEHNEFADTVTTSLQAIAPEDPPRFLARTPHGYFDHHTIREDLRLGGFTEPADIATVTARSRATGAAVPAVAYCQGTPLRNEIEARRPDGVGHATAIATQAIAHRFGNGPVDGKIQAHVVAIQK